MQFFRFKLSQKMRKILLMILKNIEINLIRNQKAVKINKKK